MKIIAKINCLKLPTHIDSEKSVVILNEDEMITALKEYANKVYKLENQYILDLSIVIERQ
jgi:hypothetical protein